MIKNFRKDIVLDVNNYLSSNPINKSDVKRKKLNGNFIYEKFYLIDFLGIKSDSYVISSFGRVFSLITNKELKVQKSKSRNNQE